VRRQVYEAVRDKISQTMSWVKWIDLQKGQFNNLKEDYPLPLPCILVEISHIMWETFAQNRQMGKTIISVYIFNQVIGETLKNSEQESTSLKALDKIDEVFQKLSDLAVANLFKRLVRVSDHVVSYLPGVIVHRMDFQTTLFDQIWPQTAPIPPANITVELTHDNPAEE